MAYLGNAPARSFISFERQVFTIVNSQTAYTLDHSVNNENDLRLVINNIVQEPGSGKAYTASGTTLTLSAALVNGTDEMYCVFLGRATATNAPSAGSVGTSQLASDAVTEAKIADDAVESEHLNDNVISGQTELAAEPADTDEFLVSDAGTLKRIDYSYLKGGTNTPAFYAYQGSVTSLANNAFTKVTMGTEVFDTASAFSSSRFTVPSGQDGKYFFHFSVGLNSSSDFNVFPILYVNGAENTNGARFRFHHKGSNQSIQDYSQSAMFNASAGDYFEVYCYQQSGGSINTYNSSQDTFFFGYKIIE